mgnify:CR=1 FL=1
MFLYLASPYSHDNPEIMQMRYFGAMDATAHLLKQHVAVYSPIVHCHEIAKVHELPTDFEFWMRYNYRMLSAARKLLVLTLDGWDKSVGVRAEITYALTHCKPVLYRTPVEIMDNFYSHDEYML